MATYISLCKFTDQGLKNIKGTTDRAAAFRAAAADGGVKIKDFYWTMGTYDIVLISEAPDDETYTKHVLKVAMAGNIVAHTLKGFDAAQMSRIVADL